MFAFVCVFGLRLSAQRQGFPELHAVCTWAGYVVKSLFTIGHESHTFAVTQRSFPTKVTSKNTWLGTQAKHFASKLDPSLQTRAISLIHKQFFLSFVNEDLI